MLVPMDTPHQPVGPAAISGRPSTASSTAVQSRTQATEDFFRRHLLGEKRPA